MLQDISLETMTDFEGLSDPVQMEKALAERLAQFGFDSYSYLGFGAPFSDRKMFVACNYPDGWVSHYVDAKYIYADPMLTTAKRSRLPFYWQQLRDAGNLNKGQQKIINEGAEHGIREGLTIPIHGPSGEFAQLSIASDLGRKELDSLWKHKSPMFHMIGVYFHAAIWGFALQAEDNEPAPLSPREAEILTWTARGKSAWEISEILSVSERTVTTHLYRAYEKLGTVGKAHSIAKACVHGLIRP